MTPATTELRPLERRVRRLRDDGVSVDEIAWRFRRSPGFIRRVLQLSEVERRPGSGSPAHTLRPVERVVLGSRERGVPTTEIASRLRRSPNWVSQVESFAQYKLKHA